MYATLGASEYPMVGVDPNHRIELLLGFLPELDEIVLPLAMAAMHPYLEKTRFSHGDSITFPEPLWPDSEMYSFLITLPAVEIVPTLTLSDGVHVEFLQVTPVFPSEIAFKAKFGVNSLIERWRKLKVRFWNPHRTQPAL